VKGVIAQRLVRKLCPHCAREHRNASHWTAEIARHVRGIEAFGAPNIREARGCAGCNATGYSGRTTIAEILLLAPELHQLILSRASDAELDRAGREAGMASMYEIGAAKAWQGETTIEEVLRATRMQ
jgi:general secretion pathway protein E